MVAVGAVLFPLFLIYESKVPPKPVVPMRWLRRGPILGACLIGFFDFVSFYLQNTYLYRWVCHHDLWSPADRDSFAFVTRDWTYRGLTYFSATQSLALTVFGIIGGMLMFATRRFKVSRRHRWLIWSLTLGSTCCSAGCSSVSSA